MRGAVSRKHEYISELLLNACQVGADGLAHVTEAEVLISILAKAVIVR